MTCASVKRRKHRRRPPAPRHAGRLRDARSSPSLFLLAGRRIRAASTTRQGMRCPVCRGSGLRPGGNPGAIRCLTKADFRRRKAKSESMQAMGKVEFQHSKTSVLDYIADMLGTETRALESAAAAALVCVRIN